MSADSWSECPQCYEEDGVREYKEVYIANKHVCVNYSGECCQCGFKVEFSHKHPFKIDMEAGKKGEENRQKEIETRNKETASRLREKIKQLKVEADKLEGDK